MTGYRALAKNRDFTILWTGQTVSDLGSNVSMFVFPLAAYALSRYKPPSTYTILLLCMCTMAFPAEGALNGP